MVSVALTRQSLGVASEFNAFQGYEVHLTEDGGVATGPSAASTLVTRVVPVLGEARFSSFNISPSFPGLHGFAPSPVRWPYIMGEQTGFVNEVRRLNLTDSTTSSATASFGVGSIIAASATRPGISYGYLLRFSQEVRRWNVADETNASTSVVVANAGREFESVRLDAAGNIWLGGDYQGYIQKRDEDGNLIFEVQVPGGPGSSDRYSNFVVPDGLDGALVLNQDNDGGSNYSQWLLVDADGNVTDVTDSVTVDGQPWASEITAAFGGPGVMIGSYGNLICFNPEGAAGSGTDLLYGIVTDTPAGTGWTVGRVHWPRAGDPNTDCAQGTFSEFGGYHRYVDPDHETDSEDRWCTYRAEINSDPIGVTVDQNGTDPETPWYWLGIPEGSWTLTLTGGSIDASTVALWAWNTVDSVENWSAYQQTSPYSSGFSIDLDAPAFGMRLCFGVPDPDFDDPDAVTSPISWELCPRT